MTVPEWIRGKQLSEEERAALHAVRVPDDTLGNLDLMQVPDEFVHLRAVADAIHNMSIYDGERATNCRTALFILDWVCKDLAIAEEDVRAILDEIEGD